MARKELFQILILLFSKCIVSIESSYYSHKYFNSFQNASFCDLDVPKTTFKDFLDRFPKYIIPEHNVSEPCLAEIKILKLGVENSELWALKMIDSTAKLPSGILNGNINQYGDFDQCLSINESIVGKYCLATFHVFFESEAEDYLVYSNYWSKSNLTDVGHRVPKVSSINWGVCLPSACSAEDLKNGLKYSMKNFQLDIVVEERMCTVQNDNKAGIGKMITVLFFSIIIMTIIMGTIVDLYETLQQNSLWFKILQAFSIKKNGKELFCSKIDGVPGIDGIRGLNALGLLLSHKSISLFFNPFINRTKMAEVFSKPWSIIGRTAIIYTDSFLVIGGFLSARSFFIELKKSNRLNFYNRFTNRLFRILPNFISIILVCTYILPDIANGPQWGTIIKEHSRLCKLNMWKNFLFIHNYMGFENMCLTHTHHLGIDMQLFLVTPFFCILLWSSKFRGFLILILFAAFSTLLRYWATIEKEISMVVYNSMSVKKYFEAANYSYILPSHRLTVHLMGVGMADILLNKWNQNKLNRFHIWIGWIFSVTLALLVSVGPMHMAVMDYKYNVIQSAYYNAFCPIIWGSFVCWVMWANHNSCSGWFGKLLCWKGFQWFSKISYAVYLTQFPVFFYGVGIERHADYFKITKMFNIYEFSIVIAVSILLVLFVEMPFYNIFKIITENKTKINQLKTINDANNNIQKNSKHFEKTN